jgi:hypothetical protein|tara:strand:- start:224 stop:982 length:759 start_codon:yes stop_codon:yes gene_type:complete
MEVKVGGSRSKIRNVDTDILFGYVERSGVSMSYSTSSSGGIGSAERTVSSSKGKESSYTVFLINELFPKNVSLEYGNLKPCGNLAEEMGRTRRLERSINNHIPKKIERLQNEMKVLDKKSPQYKRSMKCRRRKIADEKVKLKDYRYELKYRKRLVYNCSQLIIPAIYIIRRPKYNRVIAKWRFMGKTQKPIHLGTMVDVGKMSDTDLKERSIRMIRNRFSQPLDTLTLKWIKDENNRLNAWCERMGYKIRRG